jgi:hypothetical protein
MPLSRTDISDIDFLDSYELGSDGYYTYLSVSINSTNNIGSILTLNNSIVYSNTSIELSDNPVQFGDRIYIQGSTSADGYYTINGNIDPFNLILLEPINSSTGGIAYFMYPAGALKIGFDKTKTTYINHSNVQQALEDLDFTISNIPLVGPAGGDLSGTYPNPTVEKIQNIPVLNVGIPSDGYVLTYVAADGYWEPKQPTGGPSSSLTPIEHEKLRQLIHLADGVGGPMEGFPTGAYKEVLPAFNPFPTSVIWWSSPAKVKKYVEKTITYNSNKTPSTLKWSVYDTDGVTELASVTDTITYLGIYELSRIRTIIENFVVVGSLDINSHKYVRQLIHLADGVGGPFEGFTSGAYRVMSPVGLFPSSVIWYEDNTMSKKIVEKSIIYNTNKTVSSLTWKVYDTDGSTVLATVTDSISYVGMVETNRTRAIS